MTGKKKFESSAHKRKLVWEKQNREKELLKSIPKLTGFFKSPLDDSGPTGSSLSNPPEAADEAGPAQVEVTATEQRSGAEEEEEGEAHHEHQRGGDKSDGDGPYSSDQSR